MPTSAAWMKVPGVFKAQAFKRGYMIRFPGGYPGVGNVNIG